MLGLSGCLAFLLILTSRLDELANLRGDLQARLARGRQERFAAKVTWEAIQRIELCDGLPRDPRHPGETARKLGCDAVGLVVHARRPRVLDDPRRSGIGDDPGADGGSTAGDVAAVSGPSAVFRLSSGQDLLLTVALHQTPDSTLAADIAFRFLQRLAAGDGRTARTAAAGRRGRRRRRREQAPRARPEAGVGAAGGGGGSGDDAGPGLHLVAIPVAHLDELAPGRPG